MTELTASQLIDDRFEIERKLGQGGQGITYVATDHRSGERVALKELAVETVDDWKTVELFDREAEALEKIDHPKIPSYITHFHVDADGEGRRLFLVQEFVDGQTLEELIDSGLRIEEAQAVDFMRQMLAILDHIHGLDPPVIHRDVKPSNIIRRPDHTLALVDFGAAQTIVPRETGGSTVVGTTGYMPLEQLMGRAEAATDLYALGATTLHLLSHHHPGELEVVEMRLQFRHLLNVSSAFVDFLERLLEPHVEDRFGSAAEALEALDRLDETASTPQADTSEASSAAGTSLVKSPFVPKSDEPPTDGDYDYLPDDANTYTLLIEAGADIQPPATTDIEVRQDAHGAIIDVPAQGLKGPGKLMAAVGVVSAAASVFMTLFLFGVIEPTSQQGGICCLPFVIVVCLLLVYNAVHSVFAKTQLRLDDNGMMLLHDLFGWRRKRFIPRDAFRRVQIIATAGNGTKSRGTFQPTHWALQVESHDKSSIILKARSKAEQMWVGSIIADQMDPDASAQPDEHPQPDEHTVDAASATASEQATPPRDPSEQATQLALTNGYEFLAPLYAGEPIEAPYGSNVDVTTDVESTTLTFEPPAAEDGLAGVLFDGVDRAIGIVLISTIGMAWFAGGLQHGLDLSFVAACATLILIPMLPFVAYGILRDLFEVLEIRIDPNGVGITRDLFGWRRKQYVTCEELHSIGLVPTKTRKDSSGEQRPSNWKLELVTPDKSLSLLKKRDRNEQMWVASIVRDRIGAHKLAAVKDLEE
jgi:hypothetical protein